MSGTMVEINFNMIGYEFSRGLRVLKEGYSSAILALEQKSDAIGTELLDYRRYIADGGEPDEERDEDGFLLWDRERLLEMDAEVCTAAVVEARKAFIIALYHHWERAVRKDTGYHGRDHVKLLKEAAAKNINVQPDLDRVRHLINTLKHNNAERGLHLLQHWPEVFPANFSSDEHTDWYHSIILTDAHVHQSLDIISDSGPLTVRLGDIASANQT